VHRALFKAHWEGTAKLESVADLRRIAEGAGLDGDELEAALDEGRYEDLLDANRREATQVGIDAIPAHVFGRKFLVIGAHPYEVFKQVVDRVTATEEPA
jgi:predicted DsbA family dithiol-disulfide isomerase